MNWKKITKKQIAMEDTKLQKSSEVIVEQQQQAQQKKEVRYFEKDRSKKKTEYDNTGCIYKYCRTIRQSD